MFDRYQFFLNQPLHCQLLHQPVLPHPWQVHFMHYNSTWLHHVLRNGILQPENSYDSRYNNKEWIYFTDTCLLEDPGLSVLSRAGCPGPCPDGFWRFPRRNTPQLLWAIYTSALTQYSSASWCSDRQKRWCFSAHYLLPWYWAPWKRVLLCLLCSSLQVLTYIAKISPEPSLLHDEQSQLSHALLIGEVLQSLDHFYLRSPLLDSSQFV